MPRRSFPKRYPASSGFTLPLEVPNYASADEIVVLASLASIGQGEVRRTRPKVPDLSANTEAMPDPDVQADSGLDNPCGGRAAWVRPAIDEGLIFTEVPEATTEAHPRRNRSRGKQIEARRGRNENLPVVRRDDVAAGAYVFVQIEN